ncbi:sensor histidine kinase [Hyunsoonleella pacifica]|uniref:Oxygen sensor histidine kinase NreB n=1 Tax=Hyunsoonleella pacifica TaxID=1080224 RepID=A0A4Q9FS82_9FLAO|nr:sensor histidine kinase [Hyunsoonleella pacifica]TBN18833.1 sensor histidine kinase [Hyunsoonleella pacifica]GGD05162.1 hypothetical protein GCM10011368_03710 [Hyunsoonleella pacifica]
MHKQSYKYLILILFYLRVCTWQITAQDKIDSIFILKKNLNYEKAISKVELIEDPWLKISIKNILFFDIGREMESVDIPVESMDFQKRFVLSLTKGNLELLKKKYGNIAAFEYFLEAYKVAENSKNRHFQKVALLYILKELKGQVFLGSNQFVGYIDAFRKVSQNTEDYAILSLNETVLYSKANDTLGYNILEYNKSIRKLDSVFGLLEKTNNYFPYYYHEKGIENKLNKNYDSAQYYFKKVEYLTKNRGQYQELMATNYWQISDMFLQQGSLAETQKYRQMSIENAISLRDTFYDNRLGAEFYEKKLNFKKAYEYLKKSNKNEYELSAKTYSFMSNQLSRQYREEARVKYDTAKKEEQIFVEQQKLKENRNWLISSIIIFIMGTGVAILLQKNTSKKRKLAEQEALLKQQRIENLIKEQELVSIDAMIEGQEKERQKVAGELHDDLGSLMATIKLHFENAEASKKDKALKKVEGLLEEAYQKIRGMARSRNSGMMSDQGLLQAIKKMAKTITEANALKVTVEDFGMGERIENSLELSVFRMVQELVANAIKHSEASQVNIQLSQYNDNLNIIVEDNGKGFDRSQMNKNHSGMGLTNIEKRVEHLEGNFTIDSIIGKGTSILIDVPI